MSVLTAPERRVALETAFRRAFHQAQLADLPYLSPMGPLILATAWLEVAKDTRSFARQFELAHALVLREVTSLETDLGLLITDSRGERSSRVFFDLSAAGVALFETETPP